MMRSVNQLLLHRQTQKRVSYFLARPSQVLLITGSAGSGKRSLAAAIAADLLNVSAGSALQSYPFFLHLSPAGQGEISIEAIRTLVRRLKLKTPGSGSVRRLVLIEDAQALSAEAQTALLKTLEEPSAETLFILTAPSDNSLLPTINSRAQQIHIQPIGLVSAKRYFDQTYLGADIETAWQMSQGAVGLMQALLADEKSYPLKEAVQQAKLFLSRSRYERLLAVEQWGRQRVRLDLLLFALARVLTALNHTAIAKGHQKQAAKILAGRRHVYEVQRGLEANTSPRLAALHLVLNLPL